MAIDLGINRWVKVISDQGNIRGIGVQATGMIREMARVHGLRGMGARGLGEAVLGATLLGAYCKSGERINLNIQGSGFFKQALVDANPEGHVRGYVVERSLSKKEIEDLEAQGTGPWGHGLLSVLRTKGTEGKQPYIGTVPILTGHLAKDLTFYWVQSEQISSSVGLAVNLDSDGQVSAAGGFLIQALPGASDKEVAAIERHIHDLQSLAAEIATEGGPMHILSRIFESTTFFVIEEKPIEMRCQCSWERVERALSLVGAVELQAMLDEDRDANVRCDFCSKEYKVGPATLEKLILKG
jgi:molecular chaperone Hsp33